MTKKAETAALLADAAKAKATNKSKKVNKTAVSNNAKTSSLTKRVDSYRIDPKDVVIDPKFLNNPRTEFYDSPEVWAAFKQSIVELGVTDPIKIAFRDGKPYLSHGERRMRAVTEINAEKPGTVTSMPFVQVPANEMQTLLGHFIFNSGKQLTDVERGKGLLDLRNLHGLTLTEIAKKTFIPYQLVVSLVNLVEKADHEILTALQNNELTTSVAKQIVNVAGSVFEQKQMLQEGREAAKAEAEEKATAAAEKKAGKRTRKPKTTVEAAVETAGEAVGALANELGTAPETPETPETPTAAPAPVVPAAVKIKGRHIAEVAAQTLSFEIRMRILLTKAKDMGKVVDQDFVDRVEAIFDFVHDQELMTPENVTVLFESVEEQA